jgi:hypothetical protein
MADGSAAMGNTAHVHGPCMQITSITTSTTLHGACSHAMTITPTPLYGAKPVTSSPMAKNSDDTNTVSPGKSRHTYLHLVRSKQNLGNYNIVTSKPNSANAIVSNADDHSVLLHNMSTTTCSNKIVLQENVVSKEYMSPAIM